jgi:3-carboxy-cis,cis-muconate cycloisomerase
MPSRLIHGLVTSDAVSHAFSDEALVQAMFQFEGALARAEGTAGVIPASAAAAISQAAGATGDVDATTLLPGLRSNATLSIGVVDRLTTRVESIHPDAAPYVHWGATSQDVYDTAVVLCLRNAWVSIESDHRRLVAALDALSVRHADTLMLGRTLLQPAVPTTFGLKAAGWLGSVARSWQVWSEAFDRTQVLQFGGAAGTLASLGVHGTAVEQALAVELSLGVADAPWHAHRDRTAGFVAAAGVHVGGLGKIARDVSLLMQPEIGEVSEAGGGSSSMPHKRNPAGCATVLACAHRLPGLVATMLTAMTQEHERAVGGWHVESATLVDAIQASAAATAAMADLLETLTVNDAAMARNIDATRGVIFAERLTLRLSPVIGRRQAVQLVKAAVDETARSGRTLADVVASTPDLAAIIGEGERDGLFRADTCLGSAEAFRVRLLASAARPGSRRP